MGKKPKRTKHVATFEHPCDDFTITDDEGNEYHPHAEETVTFRRDMPFGILTIHGGMTNTEYAKAVLDILVRQIMDWDWTDDYGDPYPKPRDDPQGFVKALIDISDDERWYLRNNCWQEAALGEATGSES